MNNLIGRWFSNFSLRTKIILSFVLVGILSVAGVAFRNTQTTTTALTEAANQTLLAAASQTAIILDDFFTANLNTIRVEAQLPIMGHYLELPPAQRTITINNELISTLDTLAKKDRTYVISYGLLDQSGIVVAETYTPDIGTDQSGNNYFKQPVASGWPYISSVEYTGPQGAASIYFSAPVRSGNGEIIGVLRMRYNATILQDIISKNNGLAGTESFAVLLDENHIRLADGFNPDQISKSVMPLAVTQITELLKANRLPGNSLQEWSTQLPDFEAGLNQAATQPYFTSHLTDSDSRLGAAAVTKLKEQPWLVAFFQPQAIFLSPIQAQVTSSIIVGIITILVVTLIALALGQYLAGPIVRLTATAHRVAAGNLTAQAIVESQDETGQLAQSFNSMTEQLRSLISSLEEQIRERTTELALSMQVGQKAAAIRDLTQLLPTITHLIRNQFNLYYTQVYFVDDLNKNLVLKAGTGQVGKELLARYHSLPIDSNSIIGLAATEGHAIVVPDTTQSNLHQPDPLLPNTRSELAVPLMVEDRVIGVLDLQNDHPNTFTELNQTVFEAMATQLAISIDSAQQWTLAQESKQKAEETLRQYTRQSWTEKLASRQKSLGYAYDLSTVVPLQTKPHEGRASVPVVVQNERIGQLIVEIPPERTLSANEQGLLAAVAQQLSQKVENLRLFEETQQRATREQTARQITDKIRASRDIETALKTAAEELTKALGAARAVVDLKVEAEHEQ